ncbi:hypothetical protein EDD11_008459 [Mortierella claussenii]|nr:hypothetical protein EDD11_008459 [Mortierella claussenii]
MISPSKSSSSPLQGQQNLISDDDSGYSSILTARCRSGSIASPSTAASFVQTTIESLKERFVCAHASEAPARKRYEQTRDHPDRIHPADIHVLPPDPEQLPLRQQAKLYIMRHHMSAIRNAITVSTASKDESGAMISRFIIRLHIDPLELLQTCSSLGNQFLTSMESVEPTFQLVCCQVLQEMLGEQNALLAEQVRLYIRLKYLPYAFREYGCALSTAEFCEGL